LRREGGNGERGQKKGRREALSQSLEAKVQSGTILSLEYVLTRAGGRTAG
jgi:hypothetical protein